MKTKVMLVIENEEEILELLDLIKDYIYNEIDWSDESCDISARVKSGIEEKTEDIIDHLYPGDKGLR